jgi:predicted DNA-binding WGR domain protein
MARRFTCTEDGSSKFWEGGTEGSSLTTRWGKVGTGGQSKTKSFASPEGAQKELDKLIHEKLGKGDALRSARAIRRARRAPHRRGLGRRLLVQHHGRVRRAGRPAPVSIWSVATATAFVS